jgi:hypothetical protein
MLIVLVLNDFTLMHNTICMFIDHCPSFKPLMTINVSSKCQYCNCNQLYDINFIIPLPLWTISCTMYFVIKQWSIELVNWFTYFNDVLKQYGLNLGFGNNN